jgi:signal transduction histidine kinase
MRRETASRLARSIGLSAIALMVAGLVLMFVDRHAAVPTSASSQAWNFANVLSSVVNIAAVAFGILLASRRPENRIGWLFLAAGVPLGLAGFGSAYGVHALVLHHASLPFGHLAAWLGSWTGFTPLGVLAFLFLLFPTGHLRSPRWRPVAWFVAVAFALVTSILLFFATRNWKTPYVQQSSSGSGAFVIFVIAFTLPLIAALVLSVAAVVVRFRGSVGDERLQLKWFATGAVLVVATFIPGFFSGSSGPPGLFNFLQSLAFVFLFSAIAIAVLKYRLYEIDVVINKAVVYGALAVFITVVYAGLVVGVGTLVGNRRSPLLSAIAAALIAVAFQPARERSRRLANRVVFGRRATPYEVLSDFAERMAGTYSVEDVLPRTARMLADGTGAVRADVWLLVGSELRAEGSWPDIEIHHIQLAADASIDVPGATAVVPVRYQGELLGALSVQKAPGDPITPTEGKLLGDVASQAGLVLRNVRLIEELRASRQRLVVAQDQERRKIERNIHDGAQQQLVALAMKVRLIRSFARRDPEKADSLLEQTEQGLTEALDDLRDLARGIYPPLLADQGLVAALTAQARKSPVPVSVDGNGIGRFPQDAEAAVYFCALEALQNVAKYAGAAHVDVQLRQTNGYLAFEVADDGAGFDPAARGYGTGLQGMADRLAALGGELSVRSAPGEGTTVMGRVPVAGSP